MSPGTPIYRLPRGGRNEAAGVVAGAAGAIVGTVGVALWTATQYTAFRLGFHPGLGPALVEVPAPHQVWLGPLAIVVAALGAASATRGRSRRWAAWLLVAAVFLVMLRLGPVYPPLHFFVWWWRYGDVSGTEEIWTAGMWIATIPSHLAVLVGLVVSVRRAKRIGGQSDTHGSARWATRAELDAAGLLDRDAGVYVGAWADDRAIHYLRHDGPQHVLAFAPARSGKGVGLVIPTLLSWPSSVIVHDIKGENWGLTAGWRRQELGHYCLKFDPTAGDGSSARYNPLLEVRPWPDDVKDAQNIADLLIDPAGEGGHDHWDLHWNLTAHDLLVGVILHVLYAERDKTFRGCLAFLADPGRPIENALSAMLTTTHDPSGRLGWSDPTTGQSTGTHPVVAGAARALLNKSDNERSSVVSSAVKFLNLYRDPIVAGNTETCDFAIRDLVEADRPVSLYLTTPPSDVVRTRPLLRLLLNQLGRRLTETLDTPGGHPAGPARPRLLLMLDEFPALGRLDFLQTALAYLPGYGITAYLIVQDLAQLAQTYGRDESIVSNCHVRVAYAANKVETARTISDMAGTMTVHRETRTYTGNRLNPILMHVMASEQETQRPLLTPDEVMRLPDDAALIFVAGQPPIYGRRIRYYEDPIFAARASIQPPTSSDRLPHQWRTWGEPASSARTALAAPIGATNTELAALAPIASGEEGAAVDSLVPLTRSSSGADPDWPLHESLAVEPESHDGGS
jgi:type IV secretion system protein VirD4